MPVALDVKVEMVLRLVEVPLRRVRVTGEVVSAVFHSMTYDLPASAEVGMLVKKRVLDCAKAAEASAETARRAAWKKRILAVF